MLDKKELQDLMNKLLEKGVEQYEIEYIEKIMKELNLIKKTRLEEVRNTVEFYNNKNPYIIENDTVTTKDLKEQGHKIGGIIKIILIQDLNRIVNDYEYIITEKAEESYRLGYNDAKLQKDCCYDK